MAGYFPPAKPAFGYRPYQHSPGVGTQPSTSPYKKPTVSPQTIAGLPYQKPQFTPDLTTSVSAPAGPQGPIDFSNDPILARVRALGQQSVANAEANALSQKQQLAIGYGDPAFAQTLGLDSSIAGAAGANPFSTTKELARTYKRRDVFDINRPLSDQRNLFYSSERGRQLALSGEQNLRDQAQAQAAVQSQLQQIAQAVVQAKLQAQADELQAEQDAYQRALQQSLAY